MQDIVPEMIEAIRADYEGNRKKNKDISALEQKIEKGNATFEDAHNYATYVGEAMSEALKKNITEETLPEGVMYFNIAERAVKPFLEEIYKDVLEKSAQVQKWLNQKGNIGMNALIPEVDNDRIKGIIDKLSNGELY